jgi:serine protease Do
LRCQVYAPLAERVMPALVNISAALKEQAAAHGDENTENQSASPLGRGGTPFDQFLKRFFEQPFQFRSPAEKVMALGSGFIIDPTGYIVTNNHVVANADKVTVIFQDDSRHAAKVIGRDEKADIALLKIDTNQNLTYVTWGKSDVTPRSAIGWSRSATRSGSAAREPPGSSPHSGATSNRATTISCQIDAPINRGNTGGPTFNLHGQVIGINTAIYSVSGGSVRIGFAVPSNIAKASSRPAQGTRPRHPGAGSAAAAE